MRLLGAIVGMGLLLGWGLGGGLRNLAQVRIRWWPALIVALALQFVPVPSAEGGLGTFLPVWVLVLSYVILIAVVAVNWRLRGFVVILLGLVLNAGVIAVNRGMPVSRAAIVRSGNLSLLGQLPAERGGPYHEARPEDVLLPLTDVIPVREPFGVVVSVGDIATYGGAALFLTAAMLGRSDRRREQAEPSPAPQTRARQPRRQA